PLAWAATIVLALGIGTYLGRGGEQALQPQKAPSDAQAARRRALDAPITRERARRESLNRVRSDASTPSEARQAVPAQRALANGDRVERQREAQATVPTEPPSMQSAATPAPTPAPQPGAVIFEDGLALPSRSPISVDSARALLGANPLAVPGAAIRAIYRARETG